MNACLDSKTAVQKKSAMNLPSFDTHIPFVGPVDLNSPIEWAWIAGLAADLILVSGLTKWIIAAGIVAARYECQKRSAQ